MLQDLVFLLTGAVIGCIVTLITKPIRAIYIVSRARGVDPETKVVILTEAFKLDQLNCQIGHDLAEAHITLAKRNKAERSLHLERAAEALLFAESNQCHWWSVNESVRRSIADLRKNIDKKLAALR